MWMSNAAVSEGNIRISTDVEELSSFFADKLD